MFRRAKYTPINFLLLLIFLHLLPASSNAIERENKMVKINPDTDISIEVFPAKNTDSNTLFVWQPHEAGLQNADYQLAEALALMGIEVWVQDLLQSYFLSNTASNMSQLNGDGFKSLIEAARKTGKKIVVGSANRGNIPLLRGVRDWQLEHKDHSQFAGAIAISPKLYLKTPAPGMPATLLPIANASNLNYVIMQPDKSPSFWQLKQTIAALRTSGSTVFLKPVHGVRDRFYFRADAYALENKATAALATDIFNAIQLLTLTPSTYRKPQKKLTGQTPTGKLKQERSLKIHLGNPVPNKLILSKLNGDILDLTSLKGRVVLVNFWASWCPPCVQEMPSMERLYKKFNPQTFTLIGVNMAETQAEVRSFLTRKVKVSFPIVMDYNGQTLKSWRIYAFPTSYVIDKQGKIRFSLFGSAEWDNPDIVGKIKQLVAE